MELRNYQERAVREIYGFLRRRSGNPCVVIPTGGGKTPVIATICRDAIQTWNGRVLIAAHVKELLEQSADKLKAICPTVPFGIYSAGLGSRDCTQPVIIGGIQSIYDKADQLGRFDLLIVDEAHLIPESGDGMYRQLISNLIEINPDMRVIGLTATPYRTGSGKLCTRNGILNEVCYEVSVKELMVRGFLCQLTSKAAVHEVDTSAIKIVKGEYDDKEAEAAFIQKDVIKLAVDEVLLKTRDRKSVLIFCQSVAHAETIAELLRWQCQQVREIYGDTSDIDRAAAIADFRAGVYKYLVNVNVLTTGFDAPNVDCVVLLRATMSPGLYYQMVGRGFRLCDGKENCLLLDFGTNIERHGPVDAVKPKEKKVGNNSNRDEFTPGGKKCPECLTVCASNAFECPDCGHSFIKHNASASEESPVTDDTPKESFEDREVTSVVYKAHVKKDAPEGWPRTMRVSYQLANPVHWVSEWICVEHKGFARNKAEAWWNRRTAIDCPDNADTAVEIAESGELITPRSIKLKWIKGKDFPEIVGYDLPTFEEIEAQPVQEMTDTEASAWMDNLPW